MVEEKENQMVVPRENLKDLRMDPWMENRKGTLMGPWTEQ